MTRALAGLLGAPAVLSTYSRLIIDPNRGLDDPTLVMRYSDGAIVPGNAYIDAAEIARRSRRFWTPYRRRDRGHGRCDDRDRRTPGADLDPFVHPRHALARSSLEDRRPVGSRWASSETADRSADRGSRIFALTTVGDNEPYDGALAGDTIDAIATSRGLANALIEIRQDLIAERRNAIAWAERIARVLRPIIADRRSRAPADFGSRAWATAHRRGKPSSAT